MNREEARNEIYALDSLETFLKAHYLRFNDYYRGDFPEDVTAGSEDMNRSIDFGNLGSPSDDSRLTENIFARSTDFILYRHPRYMVPFVHSHDFIEMCYVMSGEGVNEVGTEAAFCRTGDLGIISPHASHTISVNTDSVIMNILVRKSTIFASLISSMRDMHPLKAYFSSILYENPYPQYILLHTGGGELLENLMLEMYSQQAYAEAEAEDAFHRDIMNGMLHAFIGIALRQCGKDIAVAEQRVVPGDRYSSIVNYIERHCADTDLHECAQRFFLSERHLANCLKKYTGKSFSTLRQDARMREASKLLLHSSLSVERISENLGYEYPTYFMRIFKKHHGCTPSEYRQRNGNPS